MDIKPEIFREYDIRGIFNVGLNDRAILEYEKWYGKFPGVTLTTDTARAVGRAFGTIIRRDGGKKVAIGYELRPGGEELSSAFIQGVLETGCLVTNLGIALTPLVYFTIAYRQLDGGVNITGSHNVYFYNGFKLMRRDVRPIFGQELQDMRKMIESENYWPKENGELTNSEAFGDYKEYFLKNIKIDRPLTIVIDAGNGSAGMFAPDLFRALGCTVHELYTEPDASFPNHTPDPEQSQFLAELQKQVLLHKADLGVAFDADGDRVGFIDEKGSFVEADKALLVFARDILIRNPNKKILFDVKCSQLLEELIPGFGGIPFMHKTGHAPIKETMRRDAEVIFAGEKSGHFYFVENYFKIDDGLWAAARMLELMSKTAAPFSLLFSGFPRRV
ncbi:MAG: phosphomannomutase/phosphoglucomutase, partial [Patescibacteria group bacterium]